MATGAARTREPWRRLSEDERKAQIIRGCVEVLATEGYHQASLARVAREAGVSKGLISHYFADRDALMQQTAVTTADLLRADAAETIDVSARVPEVVRAAVHYASRLSETHARELRAINQIVHNLRRDDGTAGIDLNAYESTYAAQEVLFRRGQSDGDLRNFDTRVMAVTYQGAIDTMIAYFDAHPEASRHVYAEELTELLLRAIVA